MRWKIVTDELDCLRSARKKDGFIEERKETDKSELGNLLSHLDLQSEDDDLITRVYRVGRPRSDDNRILKMVCRDQTAKRNILRKSKLLRSNASLHTVYINLVLTLM